MTAVQIAEKLGGAGILNMDVRSDLDLAALIQGGLPVRSLELVLSEGLLDAAEAHELMIVPRRTLTRRKEKQQGLTPVQSDRLTRVVRVFMRAAEVLGSGGKAARWMRKENRALAGRRPLDLLKSDVGARLVERILGRIEHGVYS